METTRLTYDSMVNLWDACECGDLQKVIQTFARNQSQPNVNEKSRDSTLLHKAVDSKNGQIVSYLVGKGASVNIQEDLNNTTPLMSACKCCDARIVEYLISADADVNMQDRTGATGLHIAASNDYQDILKLLLNSGANVNVKNNKGNTPLHLAAFYGREHITEQLLKHAPDKSIPNAKGKTPLEVAQSNKHTKITELLQINTVRKSDPCTLRSGRKNHVQKSVSLNLDLVLQQRCDAEITAFFNQFHTNMNSIAKRQKRATNSQCGAQEEKIYERMDSIEKELNIIEEKFVKGKLRASQKEEAIQELNDSLPKVSKKLVSISHQADCQACCTERNSTREKIEAMRIGVNNLLQMLADLQEQWCEGDSVGDQPKSLPTHSSNGQSPLLVQSSKEHNLKERLQSCFKDVSKSLDTGQLIVSLYSKNILTDREKEDIEAQTTRYKTSEMLWNILLLKKEKEKWFGTLIDALEEDEGTAWLAEKLTNTSIV